MKFIQFVNRVLLLHDVGFLNKFSLVWPFCCISSHATSWIDIAVTKCVHELSLFLGTRVGQFEMPINVFICDSLKSLELHGDISVSATSVICLPRLESLILDGVDFQSEEAFEKLISGCLMLDYMHLHMYHDDDFTCIISSASLRRLEILFDNGCGLKLYASSLKYLVVRRWISEIFVQKNVSFLVEVDFRITLGFIYNNSIVEAVRAFDCAKALTLSGDVMGVLSHATINLSTKFKKLVKLETETYFCDCISLQDFIQSSDNLEVLTVSQKSDKSEIDDHSKWTAPVEVPRCLSNNLKKVVIDGYYGFHDEREMIRYILKHGSVLEAMKISCDRCMRDTEKLETLREICKFPRKSTVCEVDFSGQ